MDIDQVCVLLLWVVFSSAPEAFVSWMCKCLAHRESVQALSARCVANGKRSKNSLDTDLRSIVPMSSILRLLDTVLSINLEHNLRSLLPVVPGCFIGAQRHTQCLDIAHGAALLVEKALDCRSEGCFAQADIKCFFDSLPTRLILMWLVRRGMDKFLVAAIGRHQLLSTVYVYQGHCRCMVANRFSGGLTGSRLALLLARVPVESMFAELGSTMSALCFQAGPISLKGAAYVDNLYTVSRYAGGATAQAELLLAFL